MSPPGSFYYHGRRATPAPGPCLENFGRKCSYPNGLVVAHEPFFFTQVELCYAHS
jgi:hypothetical protein